MSWKTFVGVGDSLIAGKGDNVEGIEKVSWSERLARAIAPLHEDFTFTNLAKPGLTTEEIQFTQLQAALALKPDLVSFSAGGNDIRDPNWDYDVVYKRIDEMIGSFHEIGATIMTFTYANLKEILPKPTPPIIEYFSPHVERLNSITADVSRKYNVALFDGWNNPNQMSAENWSADFIHANALGQIQMARNLAAALSRHSRIEIFGESLRLPEMSLIER